MDPITGSWQYDIKVDISYARSLEKLNLQERNVDIRFRFGE